MRNDLKAYRPAVTLADVESGAVIFEVEIEGDDGDRVVVGWIDERSGFACPLASVDGVAVAFCVRATFQEAIVDLIDQWEGRP